MRPIIRQIIIRPARIRSNGIHVVRASPVEIDEPRAERLSHCDGGVALVGEVLDDSGRRAGEGASG